MSPSKTARQARILELVRTRRIDSQRALADHLAESGIEVTQATLSRDVRELRLVKVPEASGDSRYSIPDDAEARPGLDRVLPEWFLSAEGTGNLLVLRTRTGGAQPVAVAIDREDWPELLGTIAGDDTILLILRDQEQREPVRQRLLSLAGHED